MAAETVRVLEERKPGCAETNNIALMGSIRRALINERERCVSIVDARAKVWNDALKAETHGNCSQSLAEECEDIAMMIRRGNHHT